MVGFRVDSGGAVLAVVCKLCAVAVCVVAGVRYAWLSIRVVAGVRCVGLSIRVVVTSMIGLVASGAGSRFATVGRLLVGVAHMRGDTMAETVTSIGHQ